MVALKPLDCVARTNDQVPKQERRGGIETLAGALGAP